MIVALLLPCIITACYCNYWIDGKHWMPAYASAPWRHARVKPSFPVPWQSQQRRCYCFGQHNYAITKSIRINKSIHDFPLHASPKSFGYNENEEGEEEDEEDNDVDDDVDRRSQRRPPGSSSSSSSVSGVGPDLDTLVVDTSLSFRRISWLSWWAQVILTTVSSVTLLFARNVLVARRQLTSTAAVSGPSVFWLAGWGIVASLTSIVWTWGGARLSRRLLRKATGRVAAANMTRRAIRIGIIINLIGMGLTLLGAEQIVGGLAIKVLTQQPQASFFPPQQQVATALVQTVEPLDILIVQANTNTLFSHFSSLTSLLYLTRWSTLLDPPSLERKERAR